MAEMLKEYYLFLYYPRHPRNPKVWDMMEDVWKSIKQDPAPLGDGARGEGLSGGCSSRGESSNLGVRG